MNSKPKILVTPQFFSSDFYKKKFKKNKNYELKIIKGPINREDELEKKLNGCVGCIIGTEQVTKKVLSSAKDLKIIVRFGTSISNINLEEAKKRNIKVKKLPKSINCKSVARHNLALLLALTNNLKENFLISDKNLWKRFFNLSPQFCSLGVIGMGNIGRLFSDYAFKLGYKINYYSRKKKNIKRYRYFSSIKELIKNSDIISLNLPLNNQTEKIFNKKILFLMKNKFLINTSRGELVDENILFFLLKKKLFKWCGLRCF